MTKHYAGYYLAFVLAATTILLAGCPERLDVQCIADSNCDLSEGGVCRLTSTGGRWCSYPDLTCPGGYRYSDSYVDPMFSGVCVETRALTVYVGGSGMGGVSSDPPGLVCSSGMCTGNFLEGAQVRLTADRRTGSFLGWLHGCRDQGECVIAMDRDQTVGALFGSPGEALWVRQLGGSASESASDVQIDSDGNLIVVGSFSGSITTGLNADLESSGGRDIFVVKLAGSTGMPVWVKRVGGASNDGDILTVTVRGSDTIIAATFQGIVDLGNGPEQAGGESGFIFKLDADGNVRWSRKIGANVRPGAVATNGDAVVVAGAYSNSITVDGKSITSAGREDIFVLNMSAASGAPSWIRSFGGTSIDGASTAAIDADGNVLLGGGFMGTVDFGAGPRSSAGEFVNGAFLLKLTAADGTHLWSKTFGRDSYAIGQVIAVDSSNSILFAGAFRGTVDFGCANMQSASSTDDIFLAKYTSAGACVWINRFGAMPQMGSQSVSSITVNDTNDIIAAGWFCGTVSFGGPPLVTASGAGGNCNLMDVFVARFNTAGAHLNSMRAGGAGTEYGSGVVQSADRRVYVAGSFQGFAEFGGNALSSAGEEDAFIVGLAPL